MKKINIDFETTFVLILVTLVIASYLLMLYKTLQGKKCLEWSKNRITGQPNYKRCLKWD